ncbi:hypothetical protein DBO85_03620 [Pseudomonas mangrovi]|uniref:GrpB family protein n=1 Tax=Pseudomonas mangrovi TaxID=2161748 RepID=A0A2T5PDG1_9PSED|nr:hypothetical protein DBO85_03620 [Pseudomonas mangrovi]
MAAPPAQTVAGPAPTRIGWSETPTVISLSDYDATWPAFFDEQAGRLGVCSLLLRVEHVGSVVVPGLAVKEPLKK